MRGESGTYFATSSENDACHDRVGEIGECDARCGVFEDNRVAFLRKGAVETALGKKLGLPV